MTFHFSNFVALISAHPHYAATAVFLLALSEAVPVIGTVVPGSTLIVGISALAVGASISPWLLLVAAVIGAIFGDGLSFWLGQRYFFFTGRSIDIPSSLIVLRRLSRNTASRASFWAAS
jgi:membrane protein DedA with SNARE-associated domain